MIRGEIDHLLFQDESSIRDYQSLVNNWFPKGKQRIIPTYGNNKSIKLIGILNYETGHVYVQEEERYTAEIFLKFLNNVLKEYPSGKIVLILDNARIHHAKVIQPFLNEHKNRLRLVFLPPYSPELNLIEGLWKWLKQSVIHNVFYKNINEIRNAVQGFIQHINERPSEVIQRLCEKNVKNLSVSIYISHNKVNDLSPLEHFKELDLFDYSFNQISDISSVNNLEEIRYGDINSQAIYLPSQTIKKGESVVVTNPIKAEDGVVRDIVVNGGKYDESTNQIIWENITTNQTLSYQFTKTIDYPKYGGMIEFSGTVFVDVVILGEPPILSGVDDLTIPFGEEFNPLQGVQGYDAEDGDITDQIIVEGKVDIFTPGTYELVYQVTDSENQTTTATRIITVELPASSINQIPTIEVKDRIVKKGTNFDPLEGVQAYDVEDGDITNQIKVIHNNVNTNHVGTYQVIYEVVDSQGAKATRLITVEVRDIPQTGLSLFN